MHRRNGDKMTKKESKRETNYQRMNTKILGSYGIKQDLNILTWIMFRHTQRPITYLNGTMVSFDAQFFPFFFLLNIFCSVGTHKEKNNPFIE